MRFQVCSFACQLYYEKPINVDKLSFITIKRKFAMGNSTHQEHQSFHVNEGLRNAVIVILIFGIIAAISYFEWAGRLH
jgi:hypothetical protein